MFPYWFVYWLRSDGAIVRDIAVGGGNEVLVKDIKTSVQLPDQDDETAEVIVVVDEDLSVRAADTNANCLGTEEVTLSNFLSGVRTTGTSKRSGDGFGREVG